MRNGGDFTLAAGLGDGWCLCTYVYVYVCIYVCMNMCHTQYVYMCVHEQVHIHEQSST